MGILVSSNRARRLPKLVGASPQTGHYLTGPPKLGSSEMADSVRSIACKYTFSLEQRGQTWASAQSGQRVSKLGIRTRLPKLGRPHRVSLGKAKTAQTLVVRKKDHLPAPSEFVRKPDSSVD